MRPACCTPPRAADFQKLAKQAVYSLHRGDLSGAAKQLNKAGGARWEAAGARPAARAIALQQR
jgi:hypothetical protein